MKGSCLDHPGARAGSLFLLFLFFLLPGCVGIAPAADAEAKARTGGNAAVAVPSVVPERLRASYAILWAGQERGRVEVTGWSEADALLGNGSMVRLPALVLDIQVNGTRGWRVELLHAAGGRLASSRHHCVPGPAEEAAAQCPRNGPGYLVELPDAWDAPSLLGLGPLAGATISGQAVFTLTAWDPAGPVEAAWRPVSYQREQGIPCVTLEAAAPATAKSSSPFWPWHGRLDACNGFPLPRRLAWGGPGGLGLELRSWSGEGSRTLPELPRPDRPQAQRVPGCSLATPADGPTRLPSSAYVEWAAQEDPGLRAWLADHPAAVALPSYGVHPGPTPGSTLLHQGYTILGQLVLWDPDTRTLAPRQMEKHWDHYLNAVPQSQFRASEPTHAPTAGLGPGDPGCPQPDVPFEARTQGLRAAIQEGAGIISVFTAPELGRSWQGAAPWLWVLGGIERPGDPGPFAAAAFGAQPWPVRAYASFLPDPGAEVAWLDFAASDLATGWVRWVERDLSPP